MDETSSDITVEGALAQASPAVTSPFPGNAEVSPPTRPEAVYMSNIFNPNNTSLEAFFNLLFMAAIAIGAALAVVRLGYAGVVYMMTDLVTGKQNARRMISEVVLGLLLLLAVWIILNQINPDLLNLNILRSAQSS
jgi:hypothetical protein